MNCSKCEKEISNKEYQLYNTYCKDCWNPEAYDEHKHLPDFCTHCGEGSWYQENPDRVVCGRCGAPK